MLYTHKQAALTKSGHRLFALRRSISRHLRHIRNGGGKIEHLIYNHIVFMVIFNTLLQNRRKYTTIFWNVQEKKEKNDLWLDFFNELHRCSKKGSVAEDVKDVFG